MFSVRCLGEDAADEIPRRKVLPRGRSRGVDWPSVPEDRTLRRDTAVIGGLLLAWSNGWPCCPPLAPPQTVVQDVTSKFENQSVEELSRRQAEIQKKLDSGDAAVDSEFWEAVLKELHVYQVGVPFAGWEASGWWLFGPISGRARRRV